MTPLALLHLNTERGWRGGERQTFLLARELARRGHRNVVACRPGEALDKKCREAGLRTFPISPWSELALWEARRLRRLLREENIHILHAHTGHAVGLGALAVRGPGAFLVATRRVTNPLGRGWFSRWKYRQVQRIAAVAGAVAEVLKEGGIPPERVRVVHSAVDPRELPAPGARTVLRKKFGWSPDEIHVVTAGALVEQKDQLTLIRAFEVVARVLPNARLWIMGQGPLRRSLEAFAAKQGLSKKINFLGHRTDVGEITAAGDLFVLSSRFEGIGGALIDALTVGTPAATTNAGGVADLFGGPTAPELSPVGDPAALAENMLRVLRDPAEAARRVARGLENAKRFTVTAMTDAYERLYREVLCRV